MRVETVIIGGSCLGAGMLAGDSGALLIERSASIGSEYFNSYRECIGWDVTLRSAEAEGLRYELREKCVDGEMDFYALAPVMYDFLKAYSNRIMMCTELVFIEERDGGFLLECRNQSGMINIECEKLIDVSPVTVSRRDWGRKNITAKYLRAALCVKDGMPACCEMLEQRKGRGDWESVIGLKLAPAVSWSTARGELLSSFINDPGRNDAKIALIAREFDYVLETVRHEFSPNWTFISPLTFANPLEAFDAGISLRSMEK